MPYDPYLAKGGIIDTRHELKKKTRLRTIRDHRGIGGQIHSRCRQAALMAKVSFPARCAVAVVCGEHLVSQVYPASVPIEVFVDNIVEFLNDELKRRGFAGLEPGAGYELHKANGVRLDVTKTLDELGVEDGATLTLVPAVEGESFEPQYESCPPAWLGSVRSCSSRSRPNRRAHRVSIVAMVCATVLGLAVRERNIDDS